MKHFLLILMLFCIKTSFSQNEPNKEEFHPMLCRVEKDASVDTRHWKNYLEKSLELDSLTKSRIPEGIYKLTAQILIGKNGYIERVKIIDDPGYGLGNKVIKVISAYQQWSPAEMNGRQVKAYRKLPITFIVEREECEEKLPVEFIL